MIQKQAQPEDQFAVVKESIRALRKHAHAAFLSSLVLSAVGIVVISLIPNKYQASTTILVDPQKIPERYVASTITSDPNAHLNTLTQQVLSPSRLQEIIEEQNLYPELRKKKSREEVIEIIRKKIKIELKQSAEQSLSSFSITYTDDNRWLVAPVANQLATSFIEWNLKSRQQQAIVTTQFLSNELAQAQKSLEEQEAALETFRMQHAGATPDQLGANLQTLSRLQADVQSNNDAISRLDEERIMISQQQSADPHDVTPQGERGRLIQDRNRLEAELQTLRRQFTETYPDVVSAKLQLENVRARLSALPAPSPDSGAGYDSATKLRIDMINKNIERHKEQVLEAQRQIAGYQSKVQSVPVLETRLAELTRNYETSRQNYQSLLDKRLSAGMSEDLERRQQAERFTVLDEARTPEKPYQPKRLPFMAGAVGISILLSIGVTIALSLHNGAIRSEADLLTMLPPKSKIIATVPPITSKADFRRARWATVETAIASVLVCGALIAFLLRFRPIL